jgi:hypothetical protein
MLPMIQRRAITQAVHIRYRKAAKKGKSAILDEFCETTGYNRSYARRVMRSPGKTGRRKSHYGPRKRIYDVSVFYPLRTLWIAADGICGQRLQPFIPELMRVLEEKKEIKFSKKLKKRLYSISSSTIDRMLKATKKQYQLKGRATTKPGTLLRSTIAVRTFNDWNDLKPGYFETDLVAFCGESVRGDYINGLNLTDVWSGWVGLGAVMGKGQQRVHDAIDQVKQKLFFPLLGLDPDNGTEFINWLLNRYCERHQITFTRIRPNRKNDNCYVEQKNYTVLRRFIGYARYDTEEQLMIIKEMIPLIEDYVNYFQPVLKLKTKERIGSHTKKTYYPAKTPYQRLMDSEFLNDGQKQKMSVYYHTLNPMDLKRRIDKLTVKLNRTLRYKIHDLTNT